MRRNVADAALALPLVERLVERVTPETTTVFLCHRFDVGIPGKRIHSSATLVAVLEWLRRRRHRLVGIDEVVEARRGRSAPLGRSVAFTIDDGYEDQAEVASIFARFDCPVSVFLTSGFVDGTVVPWWDQLAEILDDGPPDLDTDWPDGPVRLRAADPRWPALRALEERCKAWAPEVRDEAVATLAKAAHTDVPWEPRANGRPLSWDQARALERSGLVAFGPHTVSHPILSALDDESAAAEIAESWRRLQDELASPLPVFCYPNGRAVDFSERDVRLVRAAGCIGAVTAEVGYADTDSPDAYRIARVPLPPDVGDAARWVSGFETLAARTRSWRKR
jgi:peptidoglycan/xylan/chitin deacetylase (PgdA/CDA1 family)